MAFSIFTRVKNGLKNISKYLYTEPRPELNPDVDQEPKGEVPESEPEPEPESEPESEPEEIPLPTHESPSLPSFSILPPELQLMIWEAASELDEVGICIPALNNEYTFEDSNRMYSALESDRSKIPESQSKLDAMVAPLVVKFKLPPVFHVCRQSRYVARRAVLHDEDDTGACYDAYREYDPAKDIFFLTCLFFYEFVALMFWAKTKEFKHVGFEYPAFRNQWVCLLSCWSRFVALHQIPKVTIIKLPGDELDFKTTRQVYQIQKLFTVGGETMTVLLQIWFWQFDEYETELLRIRPTANDQLVVTFGTLTFSGSRLAIKGVIT